MKNLEYSPFNDIHVPYIQYPEITPTARLRLVWEAISKSRLPFMTRWVIYQAFRGQQT